MAEPSNTGNPVPPGPSLGRVLWLDMALPSLAVLVLHWQGAPALTTYAVAGLFPVASVVMAWLRRRGIDVIGIGVVIGIASGLLLGLVTADPRFALVRAAPGFALFGIAALGSLATKWPLMFFVARAFGAAGDPARIAAWNQRLIYPRFVAAIRRLTLVWGIGALGASSAGIACAFLLPGQVAVIAEPLVHFAVLAALLAWTRGLQRRAPPIEPATLSPENGHA